MTRRRKVVLRRPTPSRQPKKTFVLFCEGARTEHGYFEFFKGVRSANIGIRIPAVSGEPSKLFEAAEEWVSNNRTADDEDDDEVWVVCDVDSHTRLPAELAKVTDSIACCVSNPRFELWLLAHFEVPTSHETGRKVASS